MWAQNFLEQIQHQREIRFRCQRGRSLDPRAVHVK